MAAVWKQVTVALAFVAIPFAVQAGGGGVCSVTDPIWRAGHTDAETSIRLAVDNMGATVARESAVTLQQVLSALGVATKQRSLNSSREAEFQKASAEGLAQVYTATRAAEKIRQAHNTYGAAGQAVGACEAVEMVQRVSAAFGSTQERAFEILNGGAIFGAPGDSRSSGQGAGQVLAMDKPEAVSAEAFLNPDTPAEFRDAFMNNVIGLPIEKPQGKVAVADRAALLTARRIEAVRAPARVSLAVVRAATEESGHAETDEGASGVLSSFEAADLLIGQYGGGPAYEQWSAALVTKSEVGILKEIARLRSIQLMLNNTRQGSADRRQVIISALIGAEAVR